MATQQGPNKRTMVILVSILGVLAVVAVFRLVLSGGSDGGSSSSPPPTTGATPAAVVTDTPATTPPGEPTIPSGDFDALATRDPFEPAVQLDAGSSAATGESTSAAAMSATPPPSSGGTDTPTTTTTTAPPAAGTTVTLLDVYDNAGTTTAQVQVGGTVFTVSAGQAFATSFKVVSLSGTCGQFLYGDSPFSMCKGDVVVK